MRVRHIGATMVALLGSCSAVEHRSMPGRRIPESWSVSPQGSDSSLRMPTRHDVAMARMEELLARAQTSAQDPWIHSLIEAGNRPVDDGGVPSGDASAYVRLRDGALPAARIRTARPDSRINAVSSNQTENRGVWASGGTSVSDFDASMTSSLDASTSEPENETPSCIARWNECTAPRVYDPASEQEVFREPGWIRPMPRVLAALACPQEEFNACLAQYIRNDAYACGVATWGRTVRFNWTQIASVLRSLAVTPDGDDGMFLTFGIMAHEEGHVMLNKMTHASTALGLFRSSFLASNPSMGELNAEQWRELFADHVAGFILFRLNLGTEDLTRFIRGVQQVATSTHPGPHLRRKAILFGWQRRQGDAGVPVLHEVTRVVTEVVQ